MSAVARSSGSNAISVHSDNSGIANSPSISVERIPGFDAQWDAFAQLCDASYKGMGAWPLLWQAKVHFPLRTYRYSLLLQHSHEQVKIGQCAIGVGIGSKRNVFADGLQLLPEYRHLWSLCLSAVLDAHGAGRYVYGSDWSLEVPREVEIENLPRIALLSVDSYIVEAVDFSLWGSWEEYKRSISMNVRRNVQRAQKMYPNIHLEVKRGLEALKLSLELYRTKAAMYQRKALSIDLANIIGRHILRSMVMPQYAYCAILRQDSQALAALSGFEVGRHSYYLDGGSIDTHGAGWLLKLSIMQDFYSRHPTGFFVMGSGPCADQFRPEAWKSDIRYRRDARVTGFPTSVVTFTYT